MDLGLNGRVVLVTGGSRGIGRAAALAFAAEGARVAVTYRNERERVDAVVKELTEAGAEAMAVSFDLARPETIEAVVQAVLDRWGRIDVLVNNAVMYGRQPAWEPIPFDRTPSPDWQEEFRANTEGPLAAIQAVVPAMRAQGWGRIVNISSEVTEDGLPGRGVYAAAKGSLHGLTKTLYRELGPAGILVNVVMPGRTLTERLTGMLPAEVKASWEDSSPLKRLLGPEEVVPIVVFLCSDANTALTGEILRASGGRW